MRWTAMPLLLLVLLLAACDRNDAVPAERAAAAYEAARATELVTAAAAGARADHLARQADTATDPAEAARLRREADAARVESAVALAKAQALAALRDEARQTAVAQRQELDDRAIAAQEASDRRWAWIIAGIGCALSAGAALVCWRIGLPLWPSGAAAATFLALVAFVSAAPWLVWILGGAVVLGLLILAGWLLRKLWLALRQAYGHGDAQAEAVMTALANDDDKVRARVLSAIGSAKDIARKVQTHAGVQAVVAAAKPRKPAA